MSWLDAHNGAFRAIDGVPWSVRFDNCKTAVASKGGPWAVLNPAYHSYAEQLGFVPDACRIRMPTDKGKTERRIQDVRAGLIRSSDHFDTLGDLQRTSDARIAERAQQLKCPLTDLSIRVEAPTRLGKIGQRIVLPRSWDWEAPQRGVDRYALLVEQAGRQA